MIFKKFLVVFIVLVVAGFAYLAYYYNQIKYEVNALIEYNPTLTTEIYDRNGCLLYTSPSPRDRYISRMPSSA